jgi:hypothetical protein
MPTAHYIPLSALNENGLHPTHLNQTTETALRLDVEVPRSDPSDNNGGIPSTVNNGQKKKKNYINFNDRCEDLKAYKEKNGHLSVREKDDKSLYYWCRNIRSARRGTGTMKLTADGIAALDAIGFDWKSETTRTREKGISFIDRVKALRQYKEKTGHLNVTIEDNKSLYFWCTHIRQARKGNGTMKLTADQIAALDAIGFDWKKSTKVIGDVGYVFRKEFNEGWFTGTVVKIMEDGDRRCEYSDGDVEDLLLDDLVQLAKLDPNYSTMESGGSKILH